MNKKTLLASGLVAGGSFIAVGVSHATPSTDAKSGAPKAQTFLYESHGLSIEKGLDGSAHRENKANGQVHMHETARVSLAGRGSRVLTGEVVDDPIAAGGVQKAIITDSNNPKATNTMVFSYSPTANSISIGDGTHTSVIVQNPDHSYTVDGTPAADGKAAVALLRGKPAYEAATPHSFMLAYAYGHAPSAATKNSQNCDLPQCCDGGQAATAPAVCSLFDDLCECIACDKVGGQACTSCE